MIGKIYSQGAGKLKVNGIIKTYDAIDNIKIGQFVSFYYDDDNTTVCASTNITDKIIGIANETVQADQQIDVYIPDIKNWG